VSAVAGDALDALMSEADADYEDPRAVLAGLLERTKEAPGEAFKPEILTALRALRAEAPDEFQNLRHALKDQKTVPLGLAADAELFHTADQTAYADVTIDGRRETWPVRRKGFKRWLVRRYFEATGTAPNSEALNAALGVIEARAHFDGPERRVHVRVAGHDGRLYLDLCNDAWSCVEIGPDGWQVVASPPVRFVRYAGMTALPMPQRGGSLAELRRFLNVASDQDFTLAVAWLLAALRNRGPYPVLVLTGEHGSAKSSFLRLLRSIVDPNSCPLRTAPREDRDLFIAANNAHVIAYDNVSAIPTALSDSLCRLATGGGFAARELYTDQDEVLFDGQRPIGLNGIEEVVSRPDLADRGLFLALEPIPDDQRMTETALMAAFDAAAPGILGALLDAVAVGLRELPGVRLERVPRMAEFAEWATACEPALWPTGTFMAAYAGNRADATRSVLEADAVATTLLELIPADGQEHGYTAKELLTELDKITSEATHREKAWPKSPRGLAGRVRRAAPMLRCSGVEVRPERAAGSGARTIVFLRTDNVGEQPSRPSQPSQEAENSQKSAASRCDGWRDGQAGVDGRTVTDNLGRDGRAAGCDGQDLSTVTEKDEGFCGSQATRDGRDGCDGRIPALSVPEKKGMPGRIEL
jgi:hypothetical protein